MPKKNRVVGEFQRILHIHTYMCAHPRPSRLHSPCRLIIMYAKCTQNIMVKRLYRANTSK